MGPAAVIVLVCAPSVSWEGRGQGEGHLPPPPGLPLPGGPLVILFPPPPRPLHPPQVNMLIGIIVFNKLMARDGISDKSKKQRAG